VYFSESEKAVYNKKDLVGGEMGNGKWMRQGGYRAVSVAPPNGSGKRKLAASQWRKS
jgi:hypothetical protein